MEDDVDAKLGAKLSHNTTVTVGVLLTIIAAATWIIRGQASTEFEIKRGQANTENEIKLIRLEISSRIEQVQTKLESAAGDRWRSTDMRVWVDQLREQNPAIKVPSVK